MDFIEKPLYNTSRGDCVKKHYRLLIFVILAFFMLTAVTTGLFYFGIIWFNNPSKTQYPVRGVDVSSYQGEIDWNILAQQDISFVFMKATEGSSFVDKQFSSNFSGASETTLRIGAYHFFSFDSNGKTQAENFISVVPKTDNMLPPVVDIEFYRDKAKHPPDTSYTQQILSELLVDLESHYRMKPIIYATYESYKQYIAGAYQEYDIWIRDIFTLPKLPDGRAWTFWQYSNRKRLPGYNGKERYIDMNVFCGSVEEFERYASEF